MYTTKNLEKRKQLLDNPEIGKAIRAFWNVLDLTKDYYGRIHISDFMVMNIKMQKALMPGLRINVRGTITVTTFAQHSIQRSITSITINRHHHEHHNNHQRFEHSPIPVKIIIITLVRKLFQMRRRIGKMTVVVIL